jgi:hypothetical protein
MAATKTKGATGNAKPRQSWIAIGQQALTAQGLAKDNAVALGTRVTAVFLAAFAADIASLNAVAVPTVIVTKKGAVQLTAAQDAALTVGHHLVSGIRTAVRGNTSNKDVLLAYGVGTEVPLLVKNVKAALTAIATRATAEPAEAAAFGIVTDDVNDINAALAAIDAADTAQEAARASAPKTTQSRNATARRLLAGIKLIAGAGMRVFANDATTRAKFAALK